MKVIFLDFDGVITTMKSRWNLCKEKMELVKEIVDKTDTLRGISKKNVETAIKILSSK